MKSMNLLELDQLCEEVKNWSSYPLQEIRCFGDDFYLGFYGGGQVLWLLVSMRPRAPLICKITENPPARKNQTKKPVGLFLKSNLVGKRLSSLMRLKEYGRVLRLSFSDEASIELRLFPHGQNLIARAHQKEISLNKVKELVKIEKNEEVDHEQEVRSFLSLEREFFGQKKSRSQGGVESPDKIKIFRQKVSKIKKAISKVEQALEKRKEEAWQEAAQKLQSAAGGLESSGVEPKYLDQSLTLRENIERCFSQHKKNKLKIQGQELRLQALKAELVELEGVGAKGLVVPQLSQQPQLKTQAKYKRMNLSEQSYIVVGKSAKDNLDLLRQSAPFDLWLHLKDFPSSHGLIRRNKKYSVSNEELLRAIQFLFKQNFGVKAKSYQGESFEVLVVERRYVRPIKGDKIGRVNYHNEKVLSCVFE